MQSLHWGPIPQPDFREGVKWGVEKCVIRKYDIGFYTLQKKLK